MSSYEKVNRGKLSFKGGLEPSAKIDKRKKKKTKRSKTTEEGPALEAGGADEEEVAAEVGAKSDGAAAGKQGPKLYELDAGIGHAPDGKKSKIYEDLFPVETKRFGYSTEEKPLSREDALDARVKKKADRYCK